MTDTMQLIPGNFRSPGVVARSQFDVRAMN
jgi:hypothetical protein